MWRANDGGSSQPNPRSGPGGGAPPPAPAPVGSWRLGAGGGAAPAAGEAVAANRLQQDPHRQGYFVWYYLGLIFALMLLFGGVILWYLIPKTTATPFVAVAITQYEDWRIPPNSLAYEDLDAFRRLWPDERWQNVRFRSGVDSATAGTARTAKDLLTHVSAMLADAGKPGGPDRQGVVLLYLSAHGVVFDKQPCLALEKFRPYDPAERRSDGLLPVSDLLGELAQSDFRRKYPNAHVVIFLDAQRLTHSWQLGLLENTFGDRLAETLGKLPKDSKVHFVCAAGPGQEALAAPELGGTPFGHFTARALFGEAKELDGDSQSVSLRELAAYLDASIDRWADQHRGTSQRVLVFPPVEAATDVRLAFKPTASISSLPAGFGDRRVIDQLSQSAAEIDSARQRTEGLLADSQGRLSAADRAWHQARLRLVEELWLGGAAYTQKLRERLNDELPASDAPRSMWAPSLPLAAAWSPAAEAESRRKAADRFFGGLAAFKAEKKEKWLDAAVAELPSYADASSAGLGSLLADPKRCGQRAELLDLLRLTDRVAAGDHPQGRLGPDWQETDAVEVHFLRMLAAHLPWEDAEFPAQSAAIAAALRTRVDAEAAVAPRDERAWSMVEVLATPLDQSRRVAEDWLFIGTPAALDKAQKSWTDLAAAPGPSARSYPQLAATNRRLGDAWRLRDDVWAHLPATYEWALRRLALEKDLARADLSLVAWPDQLQKVLEHGLALDRDLEQDPQGAKAADPAIATSEALAGEWDAALAAFRKDIAQLADGRTLDGPSTRRLLHTLAAPTPLMSDADQSSNLRRLVITALNRHFDQRSTADTSSEKSTAAPEAFKRDGAYELLVLKRPSPLVRMLSDLKDQTPPPVAESPSFDEALSQLEKDASAAQMLLAQRVEGVAIPHPSLLEAPPTATVLRAQFRQADRLQRRTAWLVGGQESALAGDWGRPEPQDAAGEWRRFERRTLLAWHARRAADDFWGPRPGQPDAYFARAADACEEVGQRIYDRASADDKSLAQLVAARKAAALQPTEAKVERSDLATVDPTIPLEAAGNLPPGEAAIYLRGGPVGGEQPVEASLPSSPEPPRFRQAYAVGPASPGNLQLRIPSAKLKSDLKSLALYRGHVWTGPIYEAGADRPETLVIELGPPPPPVLTVRGRVNNTIDIIFIFDCSRSMLAPVALPDGGRSTRFEVAKSSFIELLQTLPPESQYRIDLLLYGHRVGWDGPLEAPDDKLTRVTLPNVSLQDDVEELFGRLRTYHPQSDTAAFNEIQTKLRGAQARGYTPLYLSMTRALQLFRQIPRGNSSSRMVICITDGQNYVGQNAVGVQPADVLAQWRQIMPSVPIHVFFIGQEANQKPDAQRLAQQTGGAFVPIGAPGTLLEQIKLRIPLPVYTVASADQRIPRVTRHLNEPTSITMPELRWNDEVRVTVRSNATEASTELSALKLRLGGGEKIALESRGSQLGIAPYLKQLVAPGDFKRESLPDPAYWLALRESTRRGAGRLFPVLIEKEDGSFTPQPRGLFAEITPRTTDGPQKPLFYSDLDFEPGHPIPIVRVATPSWPIEWVQADVQFWFSNDENLGVLLDQRRKKVPVGPMELEVDVGPDLGGFALLVTESPGAAATADSRPSLIWTSYRPNKIVHSRRPDGTWEHRYVYQDRKTAEDARVRAMAAEDFKGLPTTYSTLFRGLPIK